MNTLIITIQNQTNEDLEKLLDIRKEIDKRIKQINAENQKKDINSLEDILLSKYNKLENEYEELEKEYQEKMKKFSEEHEERIKKLIDIYKTLERVDVKNSKYNLPRYASALRYETGKEMCMSEIKIGSNFKLSVELIIPLKDKKRISYYYNEQSHTILRCYDDYGEFLRTTPQAARNRIYILELFEKELIKFEKEVDNYIEKIVKEQQGE